MTRIQDQADGEKVAAEAIISAMPAFIGIERVDIELGEDHDGDPSMWLVFHLRSGLKADEPWVRAFSDYSTKLGLRLIHSGLTRFPYTRLEPAA